MTPTEEIFVLCFMLSLVCLMWTAGIFVKSKDSYSGFLFTKRKKNIDWGKVGKWYLYIQAFCAFCSINNPNMSWILTIGLPPILSGFLLITYFFSINGKKDDDDLNSKEFEYYNKSCIRDEKLKEILK